MSNIEEGNKDKRREKRNGGGELEIFVACGVGVDQMECQVKLESTKVSADQAKTSKGNGSMIGDFL
ncbi:hypothetical protein Sjap_005056 [Stephania japonica]|uniref:Uncharacterized protein n=1 Tax=Stephania japonica TaxID=461633 RepID=A0AAP0K3C1_9MAGN